MILVFDMMSDQHGAQRMMLSAGISKALYTTAFGLMVGIPAMCAYYYLRGRVIRLVTDLEEDSEELAKAITAKASARTQKSTPGES
jgi:biopolymer transport protein ExbB